MLIFFIANILYSCIIITNDIFVEIIFRVPHCLVLAHHRPHPTWNLAARPHYARPAKLPPPPKVVFQVAEAAVQS